MAQENSIHKTFLQNRSLRIKALGIVGITTILLPSLVTAEEDFFSTIEVNSLQQEESNLSFWGSIEQEARYGTSSPRAPFSRQQSALSTAKTSAFGELKIEGGERFLGMAANNHWQLSIKAETNWVKWQNNEQSLTPNHSQLFLKDAYFDTRLNNGTWLRLGHQIITWGESEGLPIADIIAPQDSRAPGQAQLRDIREQVPAVRINVPFGSSELELVSTYQAGSNRLASKDEPFYPYILLDESGQKFKQVDPHNHWEWAAKFKYSFNGGDIALIAGDINDNSYSPKALIDDQLVLQQARVTTLATVLNKTINEWLVKGEAGAYWNQPVQSTSSYTTDQLRVMAGLEYSGWQNWRLSAEINGILNRDSPKQDDNSQAGYVVRLGHDAYNERLNTQLWVLNITGDLGSVIRWDTRYALSDNWEVTAGVTLYDSSNPFSPYEIFKDNDDIALSVKYSFY